MEDKTYSKMFNMVKKNFERGLWNLTLVRSSVKKGYITKEEFSEITGSEY